MEGLLDSVRQLTRELRREMLVVDSFIPVEYQVSIIFIIIITIINIVCLSSGGCGAAHSVE